MQIPYVGSASESTQERVKQPEPDIAALTLNEVNGLGLLTEAKCSSTPRLFAWRYETQGSEDWVPGGDSWIMF